MYILCPSAFFSCLKSAAALTFSRTSAVKAQQRDTVLSLSYQLSELFRVFRMEYEDGQETKSDFLARMILMGRVDIDEENK